LNAAQVDRAETHAAREFSSAPPRLRISSCRPADGGSRLFSLKRRTNFPVARLCR